LGDSSEGHQVTEIRLLQSVIGKASWDMII